MLCMQRIAAGHMQGSRSRAARATLGCALPELARRCDEQDAQLPPRRVVVPCGRHLTRERVLLRRLGR
jgi:hypothetical protein